MRDVEHILMQHFPEVRWQLSAPPAGVQKEAYIAQSGQQTVFVKFDAPTPAWPRLAAIGVTPPLLAWGRHAGRPYLIQTYVEGIYPDRIWFATHVPTLARFISRYHHDHQLTVLLATSPPQTFAEHIDQTLRTLTAAVAAATSPIFKTQSFHRAFTQFNEQAKQLQPVPLVPTHADPSPVNMLVTEHGLTMLDWDDVLPSDPLRDIGLILWWYLPPHTWPAFFDEYGMPMDHHRLFWWVAKRSIELALWLDTQHVDGTAHAFLDDFYRALRHEPNPQVTA